MKSQLFLQIFFSLGIFLVLAFLLRYFVVKYRARKRLHTQLAHLQSQASHLGKQMLAQKIKESHGKQSLVYFVEYLEQFTSNSPYHSVPQLLSQHGFDE